MFLLQTADPKKATGVVAEIFSHFDKAGSVPKPLQLLSASPGLLERQFALIGYYMNHPHLSYGLLAAIRYVAAGVSCHDACLTFNAELLGRLGMGSDDLKALAEGRAPEALEEREGALLLFVRKALTASSTVTRADIETLRGQGWTDGDILDAVAHGANLAASSTLFQAFDRP